MMPRPLAVRRSSLRRSGRFVVLVAFALAPTLLGAQDSVGRVPAALRVEIPGDGPLFAGVGVDVVVEVVDASGAVVGDYAGRVRLEGLVRRESGAPVEEAGPFVAGVLRVEDVLVPQGRIGVRLVDDPGVRGRAERFVLPAWLSILPPLVAILLALLTRQVILSIFCGVWVGATLVYGFNPLVSFLHSLDNYLVGALADRDHAFIILFSLSLAGMVGIMTATGGVRGLVDALSRRAKSSRGGQVSTAALGMFIFFDDYANSLIVGNTMRPLTDRLRISREKLSFLVDATAAPVATVGIISTWTAYQVGLIRDELPGAGFGQAEPYVFFLLSIPFAFYSLFMLLLVFTSAASGRDFGPMRRAEERALTTGAVLGPNAQPLASDEITRIESEIKEATHWANAVIPVVCVVGFTLAGLIWTGLEASDGDGWPGFRQVIGGADSFRALLWAAVGASIVAGLLAVRLGWSVGRVVERWLSGAKSLILAAVILLLAWSISAVSKDLHTGDFVLAATRDLLSSRYVPVLAFLIAGVISFATGTSYGTMGILIPVILPLSGRLAADAGLDPVETARVGQATIAAILGGAVFGDHCSPISDTTVLSSMACGADHVDHVRTQFPYALLVAGVTVPCYMLVGLGWSLFLVLPVGAMTLVALYWLFSRPVE